MSVATSATSVIDSHFNATPSGKKLHVLVATSSYAPDRTGMAPLNADLCEYLASRGHRISVLTCFPHYPHWRVPAAYRGKLWQRESIRGVEVYRSYAYIPSRRTTLRRIAYDTSIGATVAVRGLPVRGVDVVIAVSPPLQAGLAGSMLARLKGVPFLLEIQDLVPDLAIAVGMLQNPHAIRVARKLEQNIYRQADGILVISQGFADNLVRKGVSESKISVLPLWVDANLISPGERNGPFRKTHDIAESKTVVLYTGNMGAKQKLETVLDAATQLRAHEDLLFLFVGDGTEKARLQDYAHRRSLTNVRFLPLLPPEPKELLPQMLAAADILVLNQSSQVVDTVIPSKLFTYMASGRPVVAAVNPTSQAATCIDEAGSGIAVDAEDPAALALAIRRLQADRTFADRLGVHGRAYAEEHDRDRVLSRYERILCSFAVKQEQTEA